MTKLEKLIEQSIKTKNWEKLRKYCLSPEYQSLPYVEKNKPFVTSSKLKEFEKCELTYKLKYLDCISDRTEGERDYFIIGQALDDRLTYGEKYFQSKYEVVARRGESDKVQLTNNMNKFVEQMTSEFNAQPLFKKNPKKTVFFHEYGGMLLKAELDDYDGETITDEKSCANITTFDPEMYVLQMCFYHWLVEENTGNRCKVAIQAIDKYDFFSRSKKIEYTQPTLLAKRGELLFLLEKFKEAHETGIFMRSDKPNVVYNSPFYGYTEYGRWSEVEYY